MIFGARQPPSIARGGALTPDLSSPFGRAIIGGHVYGVGINGALTGQAVTVEGGRRAIKPSQYGVATLSGYPKMDIYAVVIGYRSQSAQDQEYSDLLRVGGAGIANTIISSVPQDAIIWSDYAGTAAYSGGGLLDITGVPYQVAASSDSDVVRFYKNGSLHTTSAQNSGPLRPSGDTTFTSSPYDRGRNSDYCFLLSQPLTPGLLQYLNRVQQDPMSVIAPRRLMISVPGAAVAASRSTVYVRRPPTPRPLNYRAIDPQFKDRMKSLIYGPLYQTANFDLLNPGYNFFTSSSAISKRLTDRGIGPYNSAVGTSFGSVSVTFPFAAGLSSGEDASYLLVADVGNNATNTSDCLFQIGSYTADGHVYLGQASGTNLVFGRRENGVSVESTLTAWPSGFAVIVLSVDTTAKTLLWSVNGSSPSVLNLASTLNLASQSTLLLLNNFPENRPSNSTLYLMGLWRRLLSAREMLALSVNPWRVFDPGARIIPGYAPASSPFVSITGVFADSPTASSVVPRVSLAYP